MYLENNAIICEIATMFYSVLQSTLSKCQNHSIAVEIDCVDLHLFTHKIQVNSNGGCRSDIYAN
uniref:Uncharacterized protein n=1 Tax=Arion vulgaris TaxID=1028688 RepID=A0A0B7B520_9EUPU